MVFTLEVNIFLHNADFVAGKGLTFHVEFSGYHNDKCKTAISERATRRINSYFNVKSHSAQPEKCNF